MAYRGRNHRRAHWGKAGSRENAVGPASACCLSALCLLLVVVLAAPSAGGAAPVNRPGTRLDAASATGVVEPGPWDWPSYGDGPQHTFAGRTTLTSSTVSSLSPAWFFPTGDAVTATPTVVDGTVYVGSWDTKFYAIDLATGKLDWSYQLDHQDAVRPYPGENPRPFDSDGGLVTSSAWYEPGNGTRPNLVIFGGGYTLYALNAETGALYWKHVYDGNPSIPPQPDHDVTRIFSSPVVYKNTVIFGTDSDTEAGEHGSIVAANLDTGDPIWIHQLDVSPSGKLLNNGCGGAWSSGSIVPTAGLVVFGQDDCDGPAVVPPNTDSVFALRISDGQQVWAFHPFTSDHGCDFDFGATANVGLTKDGDADFLGIGSKDGTYYSLDPRTGKLRWKTNVVFGGTSGGFIGTTAYADGEVVGSTAIGDYGGPGSKVCDPSNPRDVPTQTPSTHAFDAATGKIVWQADKAQSFGATTVAGGMSFNSLGGKAVVQVRDLETGKLLASVSLPNGVSSWSGIATVGNSLVLGTGDDYQGSPAGVLALTPGGTTPAVPSS